MIKTQPLPLRLEAFFFSDVGTGDDLTERNSLHAAAKVRRR